MRDTLVLHRGYGAVPLRNMNNPRAQTVSALVDFQETSLSRSLTNTFQGLNILSGGGLDRSRLRRRRPQMLGHGNECFHEKSGGLLM